MAKTLSGYFKVILLGAVSSLVAMALYFSITGLWGTPLSNPQQTLIIGIIVLLIVMFLGTYAYAKGREHIKQYFKDEIIEEAKYSFDKSYKIELEKKTGILKIYKNFPECEKEILNQVKKAKSARIFLQIGKTIVTGAGPTNFYDYLGDPSLEPKESIKILHSSLESPYLSEKVAHERKSSYVDWQADLSYASKKMHVLGAKDHRRFQSRQHKEGYFWRLFLFDDYAYVQPYLYKRNNSERAPVLKISRYLSSDSEKHENENSLYISFSSFFDLKWEEYRPDLKCLSEFIEGIQTLTVAAVIKHAQFYIFVIPSRYIEQGGKEVPFHGVGGKLRFNEDWITGLKREVLEETDANIEVINSARTRYITTGAELDNVVLSDNPRPYCLYKRTREVDPNFLCSDIMFLVGYEARILIDSIDLIKPKSEVGAIICLTGDMLRRTLHERIAYTDINKAEDGSRVIIGKNVQFDFSARAVPSGLATIVAAEQRPRLFNRL